MRSSKLLATLAAGFMLLASQSALAEGDAAKGDPVRAIPIATEIVKATFRSVSVNSRV